MVRTRVLLAVPLALQQSFGRSLAEADDIEIVGTAVEPMEILLAAETVRADVVVIVVEGGEVPGVVSHLLTEYPDLKVLGVTVDVGRAVVYELQPNAVQLGDVSVIDLPTAIRIAARSEADE